MIYTRLLVATLIGGALCGCTLPLQPSNRTVVPTIPAPPLTATMVDPAPLTVTELIFAGDGDTFLAHIEERLKPLGKLELHRYVTITANDGTLWQGELAVTAEASLLFLQAAQQGGAMGLEIQGGAPSAEIRHEQIALPTLTTAAQDSPAPMIDFVRARLTNAGDSDSQWSFDVTVHYPDSGWADYADGWHVETPAGEILGTRVLLHPHVGEQPFTRSLGGVTIPHDVEHVLIRGHDLISGYSSQTAEIPLGEATATAHYEVIR
ncbi:MAG: hypothetical protein R2867_09350 [Caldilineaceae bacterium]